MRADTLVGGGAGEGRTAEDKLGRDLVVNIFYNDCTDDNGGLVVIMMVVVMMTMMFFSFTQLALTLRLHIFECIQKLVAQKICTHFGFNFLGQR